MCVTLSDSLHFIDVANIASAAFCVLGTVSIGLSILQNHRRASGNGLKASLIHVAAADVPLLDVQLKFTQQARTTSGIRIGMHGETDYGRASRI